MGRCASGFRLFYLATNEATFRTRARVLGSSVVITIPKIVAEALELDGEKELLVKISVEG
ncbi:MAG: hypothetical protein ACXQTI_06615 [Candidatus Nezhaarchaeales archaeon]